MRTVLISLTRIRVAIRPTLVFITAYALTVTPHEAAHAIFACFLGFSSTLFQMWVNPETASASWAQLAGIASAGPLFSLFVGLICGLLYLSLYRHKSVGLFLLMMAMMGINAFLGPLAVVAFGGDFNLVLKVLGASAALQWTVSAIGTVLLAAFMFEFGREIIHSAPARYGRTASVVCMTVAPWLLGPLLIIAIYWPLPNFLIGSTIAGSAFWLFAVIGASFGTPQRRVEDAVAIYGGIDLLALTIAVIMVRALVYGLRLRH